MNLTPTDRDKLQAYLDALEAVPIPQIVDTMLQGVSSRFVARLQQLLTVAAITADAVIVEQATKENMQ